MKDNAKTIRHPLVVIDGEQVLSDPGGPVASWTSLVEIPGRYSLAALVERRYVDVRRAYLAWEYALGRFHVGSRPLREHLTAGHPDVSLWAFSLISEKSPLKTEAIYPVLKLWCLERLYEELACRGVVYHGSDRTLHRVLREWCHALGEPYRRFPCRRAGNLGGVLTRASLRRALPHWMQGLSYLAYYWAVRVRKVRSGRRRPSPDRHGVTLVGYFPNVDLEAIERGSFRSRYWGSLHALVEKLPVPVHWVWLYADREQGTLDDSIRWRNRCNGAESGNGSYYLLEEFAEPRVLARALGNWARLALKAGELGAAKHAFHFPGSRLNFFRFLERDWKASLAGSTAMENALHVELFDEMARRLPADPWGMYLWEHQPWELALVAAWRRHGAKHILGYQHSSLRPLDLRSFGDRACFGPGEEAFYPLPDTLVVNGMAAWRQLLACGYPEARLALAEATRYASLTSRFGTFRKPLPATRRKLLVVTGYLEAETRFQLELLDGAARLGALKQYETVRIKAHPNLPVEPLLEALRPQFESAVVKEGLPRLLQEADVVYCANSTSALLEAAWLGLPVIATGACDGMNLSPLVGEPGATFVVWPQALAEALAAPGPVEIDSEYFRLADGLPAWRGLLGA